VVRSAPDAGAEVLLVDRAAVEELDAAESAPCFPLLVDGAAVEELDAAESAPCFPLLVDGAAVEELDAAESAPCFPLLVGLATLLWACAGPFRGGFGPFRGFGRRSEEAFAAGRPRSASIVVTVRCAAARCSS
jgi:hypothetical protein